jgi:hypothetical protein
MTAEDAENEGTAINETKPPWGDDDFNPERAWKLLEDTRGDRERMRRRAEAAEHQLARLRVAAMKGLSPTLAKRLEGNTEEELAADADELVRLFTSDGDDHGEPVRIPKEDLRSGAASGFGPDDDSSMGAVLFRGIEEAEYRRDYGDTEPLRYRPPAAPDDTTGG